MYVLEFCGHLSIEVTAGCVCKILSLSLLVPLENKFSGLSFQGVPVLHRTEGQVKSSGNRRLGSWIELGLAQGLRQMMGRWG